MTTIPIGEASSRLSELIDQLQPGEEIGLTRDSETVARLVKSITQKQTRQFGLGKGKLTILANDDEHLEHFQDYYSELPTASSKGSLDYESLYQPCVHR